MPCAQERASLPIGFGLGGVVGCLNALVSRGVRPSSTRFCFPQSQTLVSVLLPNEYFELAQCAHLPTRSVSQRPTFKGLDGTLRSGCDRAARARALDVEAG